MKLTDTGLTVQDIKDKVNTYMIETYERMDFLCETARDQYMYDEKGEKYLDFYAGIAVNSAGNCNEKVVAAVIDQVQDVMHTFNYPYTIPQALLAEKVCTTIGMDKIFFQNSGTEANEAMIKMARKYGIEKYWSYVKKKYKLNVTNFLCSERSLTCYFYCILLDVFKILFLIFIWRQISTMTVNAHGIVKCFDVFKNQFMCMCIIKDFKPVDPFSLQKCMESSARQKINLRTSSGKETSERYFRH